LHQRFVQRGDHHLRCAMLPLPAPPRCGVFFQAVVGNLRGRFATTMLDRKVLDRSHTIASLAQRFRGFLQTKAKRANDPGRDDRDPRPSGATIYILRIRHFRRLRGAGIPLAFGGEQD
jgi:hypothetical protein